MLYGHIETPHERVDHVLRLRDLQDETGGFQVFIPLRYHSEHNRMGTLAGPRACRWPPPWSPPASSPSSRLLLDNVPHLKAYWIMLGLDTAQTLLEFGVDDIDGTVVQERIYHMAGAATPHELSLEHLLRVIRAARRVPVQRDTVYNVLRVYDQQPADPPEPSRHPPSRRWTWRRR